MSPRVTDILSRLNEHSEESIRQVLDLIRPVDNFSREEKNDLASGLTTIFYHFHHSDSPAMMKLAVRTEKRLAKFGYDIVPFLFNEIVKVDGESAAYLGKALAKIGQPASDYIMREWDQLTDNDPAKINLIQALSYFRLSHVLTAVPLILSAGQGPNFQLTAMVLYAIGRLIQKSKSGDAGEQLIQQLFSFAFGFLSHPQPLVRKNAARTLGKMLRKEVLSAENERKVYRAFLSITGRDEQHNWDRAFIVRREAEDFLTQFCQAPAPTGKLYSQSFRILSRKQLCPNTFHIVVEAPLIAAKIQAGQFIIVRPHSASERIPLSVCDWDRTKGTVSLIISAVGKTTTEINRMEPGNSFKDVVGPLGERSRLPAGRGTCVVIGGGYGAGAIIPTARDMKEKGNKVIGIIGARTSEFLIMAEELKKTCDAVMLTTNDGSCGLKGMVTDALNRVLIEAPVIHVLAVGPVPMMQAVSEMTRPKNIETWVSLNAIMVDGTGMCGACRVSVGGETKFACFHGPDFDGHKVDFDNLLKRQKMFAREERAAFESMNK